MYDEKIIVAYLVKIFNVLMQPWFMIVAYKACF